MNYSYQIGAMKAKLEGRGRDYDLTTMAGALAIGHEAWDCERVEVDLIEKRFYNDEESSQLSLIHRFIDHTIDYWGTWFVSDYEEDKALVERAKDSPYSLTESECEEVLGLNGVCNLTFFDWEDMDDDNGYYHKYAAYTLYE